MVVVVLHVLLAGHVGREAEANRHAHQESEQEAH
jgi:hypothetical protein